MNLLQWNIQWCRGMDGHMVGSGQPHRAGMHIGALHWAGTVSSHRRRSSHGTGRQRAGDRECERTPHGLSLLTPRFPLYDTTTRPQPHAQPRG